MSNHFLLLVRVRVPHRPPGFEVPLEVILARMERAIVVEEAERATLTYRRSVTFCGWNYHSGKRSLIMACTARSKASSDPPEASLRARKEASPALL